MLRVSKLKMLDTVDFTVDLTHAGFILRSFLTASLFSSMNLMAGGLYLISTLVPFLIRRSPEGINKNRLCSKTGVTYWFWVTSP